MDNSVDVPVKKDNGCEIILLKIKNNISSQSNIVSNSKFDTRLPLRLKIVNSNDIPIVNDLKIDIQIKQDDQKIRNDISSQSNIVNTPKM